jgi:hypothetical protein
MAKKVREGRELVFRAVFEKRGRWIVGYSPDVPGANAQERTLTQARRSLVAAVRDLVAMTPRLARRLRSATQGVVAEETLSVTAQ